MGMWTLNPHSVVWPLEMGLGTLNLRSVVWPLECVPCFIEEAHESVATPSPSVTLNEHLLITIPEKTSVYTFSALFSKKWIPIASKGKTSSPEALKGAPQAQCARSARAVQLFGRLAVLETHTLRY